MEEAFVVWSLSRLILYEYIPTQFEADQKVHVHVLVL